ncbi:NUDIX hydrolase domain-like protein [Immersiella caudata]|uniref:NUDIX hydrolase domain-like protein n=1 Tax=Immersiella caudata TaxID=314043 RepID=A0AA40BYX9_9PEZI|nr:NUDIX hydrolase domain-like protein [Immersiella caudata]
MTAPKQQTVWRPESTTRRPFPITHLTFDPSLTPWSVPAQEWIKSHRLELDKLCTNVAVFDEKGQLLLVQRANHDYWMPGKWEIPGGSAEVEDKNVLFSAARELWEETGLVATGIKRLIADGEVPEMGYVFRDEIRGIRFCRFSFEVEVESCQGVVLDVTEHQAFVWASREEVEKGMVGEMEIPVTDPPMRELILAAFNRGQ